MAQTILVVDDDADLREQVSDILGIAGYTVEAAEDGEQGLEKLRSLEPDAIILDMNMPKMGGIGFLHALRGSANRPPVIVSTARTNMGGFFEGLDVAAYLTKPYDADLLTDTVKRCLAAREERRKDVSREERGQVVLLVEDDDATAARIEKLLSAVGWSVVRAETGPAGLEKAVVEKPTAIVAKLILSGMNGDRLAELTRSVPSVSGVPVVLYDDSGMGRSAEHYTARPEIAAFVVGNGAADILRAVRAVS